MGLVAVLQHLIRALELGVTIGLTGYISAPLISSFLD